MVARDDGYLSSLYARYSVCEDLPLTSQVRKGIRKGTGKNIDFVPGSGSRRPRAIFIGMMPTLEEATARRAFTGDIGEKFEIMLDDAGMFRSDVFITYLIKYPLRRKVPLELIAESIPYLRREIEIVSAGGCRVMAVMGQKAADAFMPAEYDPRVGEIYHMGSWRVHIIEDAHEAIMCREEKPKAFAKLSSQLRSIGRYVNSLVE